MLFDKVSQFLFTEDFITKLYEKYEKERMISVVDIGIVSIIFFMSIQWEHTFFSLILSLFKAN